MRLYHGDCIEIMPTLTENSVDAVVTDPPYGLGFMGKDWDHGVPGTHFWIEALRVAKPGCHLLAFGGTRTFHRLACAIEDAGWELRDTVGYAHESGDVGDCPWLLAWTYGSGFPKSHDVSKAIDREAGIEREMVVDERWAEKYPNGPKGKTTQLSDGGRSNRVGIPMTSLPESDSAKQWQGWGTALKPAWEPIIVARKPLEGTVAENVQKWGTGAMNIDGCRVGTTDIRSGGFGEGKRPWQLGGNGKTVRVGGSVGRWPANLIHDGSDEVLELFPRQAGACAPASGPLHSGKRERSNALNSMPGMGERKASFHADSGSAARFFYCAKASKKDRGEGNNHPTVKPTDLMRYLCRLVTPPKGVVLDPFMGSGSTGKAAILEGFDFIGIEKDAEYVEIAQARIGAVA